VSHLAGDSLNTLTHEAGLSAGGRSIDPRLAVLMLRAPDGAFGRIRLHPKIAQVSSKVAPPLPKCRLVNIQPLVPLAHGLYDDMYMRVPLVRMHGHRVSMLRSELLSSELLHRLVELVGRCALRHREHQVVDKLRRLATGRNSALGVTAALIDLEIPVLQQLSPETLLTQESVLIGLQVRPLLQVRSLPRALEVLRRQLALRERMVAAGKIHHNYVFFAADGSPITTVYMPYNRWREVMETLPIRYRKPYNRRHSYISWRLMIGHNRLLVAMEDGHSVATMERTYAAWTKGAKPEDVELIKAAMAGSPQKATAGTPEKETRTVRQ